MGNIFILCSLSYDKGQHNFEKRMIISKLLGGGLLRPCNDVQLEGTYLAGELEKFQSASLCRCSYLQHIYAWFN